MAYRLLQCSGVWAIHFTEKAGRPSLFSLAENPKLIRDCQPTPEFRVQLFLYTSITDSTREVGTWTHLPSFTWQCTKASSLLVCIPVIETPPWQIPQNCDKICPKVCDVSIYVLAKRKREVEKWTDLCMIKQYVGDLGVGTVWDPWIPLLCFTSHSKWTSQRTHPKQGDIPWAHTGQTELWQRGLSFDVFAKGFLKSKAFHFWCVERKHGFSFWCVDGFFLYSDLSFTDIILCQFKNWVKELGGQMPQLNWT